MSYATQKINPELNLDEQIGLLISEENISSARKEAEGKLSQLTGAQIKYLRKRCKLDLFFLCYSVLGYDKLSPNLHGDLCWWTMRNMLARFKMILLPRSHFKSTIETIAHPIQIALPDESGGLASWPECLGTNVRVLIGHETSEQAAKFLVSIAGHFLSNPLLMGLFPECIPSAKKQRINKHELELPRNEIWNEATFDTMGVGGKSQGRHYDYLKLDDLIGDKARDSKVEMATAKDWIDNIQAFFTEFTRGKLDIIGTRWAYDDLYAHVMLIYGQAILKYIRAAEEYNAVTKVIEPIFPEAFTTESFIILKKNRKVWTSQYANDPESGANEFDKSWKRLFKWDGFNRLSAGSEGNRTHYDVMDLDRCILVDPAMSGKHGFVVTGGASDDRIFTLEAKKEEWRPNEFCEFLFSAVTRWQPRLVAIEEVLFSGLYKPWFDREMQIRGIRFNVIPVPTKGKQKEARVKGLANYFGAGAIYFHESQFELIKEFDTFGATDDYHMLDALAMGPEVWSKPFSRQTWDSYASAEAELLLERDSETGY